MKTSIIQVSAMGIIALAGCSHDHDACTDTYTEYADGTGSFSTSCDPPEEEDPTARTIEPGTCLETFRSVCPPGEDCQDLYERTCENETANVPLTELGTARAALLVSDCALSDGDHTFAGLHADMAPVYILARDKINQLFRDDGASPSFRIRRDAVRTHQAQSNITAAFVGTERPGEPDTLGISTCLRENGFRNRCQITVYFDSIERVAATTGHDPLEDERITAMHELGHTACLDHFVNNGGAAGLTAMNSFHTLDTSRPTLDYFKLLGSERDQVRSIIDE